MSLMYRHVYSTILFFKLNKKVKKFFDAKKYYAIIDLLNDEKLNKFKNKQASELFLLRGNAQRELKKYDDAINSYSIAIEKYPKNALAFYNRASINATNKRDYSKALKDFEASINYNDKDIDSYVSIASILRYNKEFHKSIEMLNKAIFKDPNFANAYYNRGLTNMMGFINWRSAINDFKKFLNLIPSDDSWCEYASYYIDYMECRLKNKNLYKINSYISKIKSLLSVENICITHYTNLGVLKKLVFDESKFRLSEGNFLNDPSEGRELFNFFELSHDIFSDHLNNSSNIFKHKPFIGSFVKYSLKDNLNMWRLYGKEDGIEAKGCAISIDKFKFLNGLIDYIDKDDEGYNSIKDDANFFYVAYYDSNKNKFLTSNNDKNKKLNDLLKKLKDIMKNYNQFSDDEKEIIHDDLVSIAFLFKNIEFKNEEEIRILIKWDVFSKKFDRNCSPPKVYIELIPLKNYIKYIKFGPKVDKFVEWAAALHYAYDNPPCIDKSELPYK